MRHQLSFREADPLPDLRALQRVAAYELGGGGTARGDVERDGVGFEDVFAAGKGEGGYLAEREAREERGGVVCVTEDEGGWLWEREDEGV